MSATNDIRLQVLAINGTPLPKSGGDVMLTITRPESWTVTTTASGRKVYAYNPADVGAAGTINCQTHSRLNKVLRGLWQGGRVPGFRGYPASFLDSNLGITLTGTVFVVQVADVTSSVTEQEVTYGIDLDQLTEVSTPTADLA